MTRRRWIADRVEGDRAYLLGAHAQHLARVLRASAGQEFDIAMGESVRRGRVVSVKDEQVEFELLEAVEVRELPELTLLLAVFKFDRMEWAIEKCTELGVARIVPLIARRTEAHLAAAAAKRVERWKRIAMQASEQSRRTRPPEMDAPAKLTQALARFNSGIVLDETETQAALADLLSAEHNTSALAVGPEGGWTPDELQLFAQSGWVSASLGATILRAETAAIAASALAIALLK
jgi:16S rRNA (uracil1498-N3)-methyltransferase